MRCRTNAYYFLVSIDDEKDAQGLYNDIVLRRCKFQGLYSEYISFRSASELFAALDQIADRTRQGDHFPLLHFEVHGETAGIACENGFFLPWEALRREITQINGVCRNNLVVTMASCWGGYFVQTLMDGISFEEGGISRAPVAVSIGPSSEVNFGQLTDGYHAFFNEFMTGRSGTDAIKVLDKMSNYGGSFMVYTCESIYQHLVDGYFKRHINQTIQDKDTFLQGIVRILKSYEYRTGKQRSPETVESAIDFISSKEVLLEMINSLRQDYFWIDVYPENEHRFTKIQMENWEEHIEHVSQGILKRLQLLGEI